MSFMTVLLTKQIADLTPAQPTGGEKVYKRLVDFTDAESSALIDLLRNVENNNGLMMIANKMNLKLKVVEEAYEKVLGRLADCYNLEAAKVDGKYTRKELESMTALQVRDIATARGITVTNKVKAVIIDELLGLNDSIPV